MTEYELMKQFVDVFKETTCRTVKDGIIIYKPVKGTTHAKMFSIVYQWLKANGIEYEDKDTCIFIPDNSIKQLYVLTKLGN